MRYQDTTKNQRTFAKAIQARFNAATGEGDNGVSVSAVVKHLDVFADWDRGNATLAEVVEATS